LLFGADHFTVDQGKPLLFTGIPAAARDLAITIHGDDAARGYVSWRLTGVPLKPPADADEGIKIRRAYLDLDGQPAGGSLRRGDIVQVRIAIDSTSELSNVVLEDLLPAGLEIENPRLAQLPPTHRAAARNGNNNGGTGDGRVDDPFATHTASTGGPALPPGQQLPANSIDVRDDRFILVTNVPAGVSTYTYLARAVTPGTYVVPPIRGECMYDISIHSLSSGGQLVIEAEK
jgi:uncharacterized protein YfaS (alpha-2-macroglobulin family)